MRRYIERPLLIHQRKFHLRVYVLCVGSLKAYVYDQVLPYAVILARSACASVILFLHNLGIQHKLLLPGQPTQLLIELTPKGVVLLLSFLCRSVINSANSQLHGWLRELLEEYNLGDRHMS